MNEHKTVEYIWQIICQTFFYQERAPKLRPVIDDDFRRTVVEYANAHGAASAASRFEVSESTLRGWRAITDKPLTCPVIENLETLIKITF